MILFLDFLKKLYFDCLHSTYQDCNMKCKTYHDKDAYESSGKEYNYLFIHLFYTLIMWDARDQREPLLDKVKRLLKVESDDTDELHNKYRETAKDREAKVKLFEEQLNIQVVQIIYSSIYLTLYEMVRQL